eukprot:1664394-Pyramimonas_sp.AAC.1
MEGRVEMCLDASAVRALQVEARPIVCRATLRLHNHLVVLRWWRRSRARLPPWSPPEAVLQTLDVPLAPCRCAPAA